MCKRSIVLLAVFGLLSWAGSSSFAQTICDDAIEIDGNDIIEGSTLGGPPATEDNEFNCGPWDSPGAWYMLLGNGGETIVTTCSGNLSTYDTALSVFAGECDDLRCIGANDDNCASFRTDSTVSWVSEVDEISALSGKDAQRGIIAREITTAGRDGCRSAITENRKPGAW